MIEVCPSQLDGAVVFNVDVLDHCSGSCRLCVDFSVGIHNWMVANDVPYIIIDFQDEKNMCPVFLEEMVHLRKRTLKPFYFVGMMPKVDAFLREFGVLNQTKVSLSPDAAIVDLKKAHLEVFKQCDLSSYDFSHRIKVSKARLQHHLGQNPELQPSTPEVEL